ncbi:hypothetical protein LTR37_012917 [Vermiconidia calcicola]|uniref:Uncharacterized protein n=1 Tax=Vermiconidia calcicola TaxID=1690605 RepID=A0ACC3MXY0_9PEZI|nr:hypothetical protein LTR37_012917 [Vermiconidia calcicola]
MASGPPPPPPPPHGQSPRPPGAGLPDGNYDIFIIPPHSAGSGFLYLPSLAVQRNSFLAGVACTLLAVGVYSLAVPVVKQWLSTVLASGGIGVLVLVLGVGVAAWAWGKTQAESRGGPGSAGGSANAHANASGTSYQSAGGPPPEPQPQANGYAPPPKPQANGYAPPPQPEPNAYAPPPPPPPQPEPQPKPQPKPAAASGWEKAREETRKREEARKREEEAKKRREEAQKAREEAERAAKAKAEKEKWEQARAREKEQREREARERIVRERLAREKEAREKEKEAREKDTGAREAREKAASASASTSAKPTPTKPPPLSARYEKPSARSYTGTEEEYSYRPYDSAHSSPSKKRPGMQSSASSISGLSESSYAPSQTTARTTPPPSQRGPYNTKDPDKIKIKAVYLFSDSFPTKPLASLISNSGPVTDGLILHIKTEGLFIDDDVRGVPQREWDVKAWTLKLVEDGMAKERGLHVLRATIRDGENKRYCFVLDEAEAWKVAVGLARLKKGSQVRALGMNGMKEGEVKGLLGSLGWM